MPLHNDHHHATRPKLNQLRQPPLLSEGPGGNALTRVSFCSLIPLGRTDNPLRWSCCECPRPHHAGTRPPRLPHVRAQPQPELGEITIELQHAPRWQLVAPNGAAGNAVRALAWLGPEEVEEGLSMISRQLTDEDIGELAEARAMMPGWIAGPVSNLVANG